MHRVPREWVLFKVPTIPMMSDYEDDLDDFPVEKETKRPNLRLEHIAQSRQINGQHELGSLQKFHHFLMSQLLFQVR